MEMKELKTSRKLEDSKTKIASLAQRISGLLFEFKEVSWIKQKFDDLYMTTTKVLKNCSNERHSSTGACRSLVDSPGFSHWATFLIWR